MFLRPVLVSGMQLASFSLIVALTSTGLPFQLKKAPPEELALLPLKTQLANVGFPVST